MSFLNKFFGRGKRAGVAPQRLDYLNEALALERQGEFDAALTSYRLALRDNPTDLQVLQNMAIAFTKTNRFDEAIRYYRRALEIDGTLPAAHYGLGFLLLKRGDSEGARRHLAAFLEAANEGGGTEQWTQHARDALSEIETC